MRGVRTHGGGQQFPDLVLATYEADAIRSLRQDTLEHVGGQGWVLVSLTGEVFQNPPQLDSAA